AKSADPEVDSLARSAFTELSLSFCSFSFCIFSAMSGEWTDDIALMVTGGEAEDDVANGDETRAEGN
ncbi:hypothetical protein Tco_1062334, partial [Tanacetum coccineum]